ncbi:MAG: acetyl-CoA acetyltransferase [Actinobacteria bacterium]|nr:acetyl-CoA acetyltransferase [Actinomycetota bacterium]
MKRRVAIVGAALSDCGRVDDKSAFQLHYQASSRALADAGLTRDDVDGFASSGTGVMAPVELAEYLGLRPTWVDSTGVGGATWEFMAHHAMSAVAAGDAETVVISYGSTTRADLKRGRRTANLNFGNRGPVQFDAPFGHTIISKYAMSTRRHMLEFGTTLEQLAEIAVAARFNARDNEDAYYREPITIEDVLSAPMMADPLTTRQCCIRSDGGGAIVLTSEERARDCAKAPVWVLGAGEATSHTTMSEWEDFTESPCVHSGRIAFEQAGLTPNDVDTCQIYDAFTSMVLITLEGLGFCKKGEGGAFVADGKLRLGDALPTNTDGGGLSACHPGMRGIFLMVEAARQLRGECGPRQVPDARIACVSATGGWFSSAATMLLGID